MMDALDHGGAGLMVAKHRPPDDATKSLGQCLARIRKERGLTQVQLAQRVGISQPNISEYERDAFRPNADTLLRIAQVLKVSADQLLGYQPAKAEAARVSRKVMRRMLLIEKLPRRDQQALLRTIDAFLAKAG